MNLDYINLRKVIIIAAGLFLALVVATVVWWVVAHGRLVVELNGETQEYSVTKVEADETTPFRSHEPGEDEEHAAVYDGSSVILSSGSYIVAYADGGRTQTKYIDIPGFLQAVNISFFGGSSSGGQAPENARQVERIAAQSLEHLGLGKNSSVLSFETGINAGQFMFVHPAGDPTGLNSKVIDAPFGGSETFTSNNHIVGFTQPPTTPSSIPGGGGSATVRPSMYGIASGKTTAAKKTYFSPDLIAPASANHNRFGVYYSLYDESGETQKLDVFAGTGFQQTFTNLNQVAAGANDKKAVAISKNYVAMGFGESFASASEGGGQETSLGDGKPEPSSDYVIKLFEIGNKKEFGKVNIGKTNSVSSIHVNDNGSFVAVMELGVQLSVYNVKSGELIYTQQVSPISPPLWVDSQSLVFATSGQGLYQLNAADGSAVTLFSSDFLSLSSYDIVGNKVLFTAYSDYLRGNNSSTPDAYAVDLTKETKNNNQLVKKLPAETDQFKVSTLRNTIYAAPKTSLFRGTFPDFRPVKNPGDEFEQKVRTYLSRALDNYEQYELIFGENL